MASLYTQQSTNVFRTWTLMGVFLIIVMLVGFLVSQYYGNSAILYAAVAFALIMNVSAYWFSDKVAIASAGAYPADPVQYIELHRIVENLAITAGLPKPRVYIIDDLAPNAFATGRDKKHAVIAVTTGLLGMLNRSELEGVLAHELSHIANRDVLIMTVASFFAMLAAMLTRFGLYAGMFGGGYGNNRDNNNNQVPVWLIVMVVSMVTYAISWVLIRTLSRYREYAADRGSALITGAPENLMSALQKIASGITQIPQRDLREVAGMNAFFIVPTNWKTQVGELFMDHPPMEKRLAALAEIAREMGRPV